MPSRAQTVARRRDGRRTADGVAAITSEIGRVWLTSDDAADWHSRSGACLKNGDIGVGLVDGLGVALPLLVLGQRPVDAGQARVVALALAGGITRSRRMSSTDSRLARRRSTVCSMS